MPEVNNMKKLVQILSRSFVANIFHLGEAETSFIKNGGKQGRNEIAMDIYKVM